MNIKTLLYGWSCLALMAPHLCSAQFFDDFSDGDFTSGPAWTGDDGLFRINGDLQLQLYDETAGEAGLYSSAGLYSAMEWCCRVKLSFSPSANNNGRIYLWTGSGDTLKPPDGIFLQFGESGSDDAIRLMLQEGGDTSTLIRGNTGTIAGSFDCRVKVVFEGGLWQLYADHAGSGSFLPEGNCYGDLPDSNGNIGVFCKYTSSNSRKFYFDDFYAGPVQYDTIPPEALQVAILPPDGLEVVFSEALEEESACLTDNYFVDGGVGHPVACYPANGNPSVMMLQFAHELPYGMLLKLAAGGVKDLSGNAMLPDTLAFSWYETEKYDIVINEIMADPSPPAGLPEHEYLELFNTTSLPVDLAGWTLVVGTAEKDLTGARMAPGGYLIIGKDDAAAELAAFGTFFGLESFSLTNAGQHILLSDSNGAVVSNVTYSSKWYCDEEKAGGGWSLEQINPYNPCLQADNWAASQDFKGGTPGGINSVYEDIYVEAGITGACVADSQRIRLEFNQSLGTDFTLYPGIFSIDHDAGPVEAILPEDPWFTSFILYPAHKLKPGITYSLECKGHIRNCLGDSVLISQSVELGLPEEPETGDLVINEVLFNPFPGGSDYVELYNRSDKAVSLTGLRLASISDRAPAPPDTSICTIEDRCRVLLPGEYALLCENFTGVDNYYLCSETAMVAEPEGFPSYSNEAGMVLIMDAGMGVIDRFDYHEDMHYPLLNIVEGVSLERIHHDRPATDATNWHSASQLAGFGTPGYRNSQFSAGATGRDEVSVSPGVFSPGTDGYLDHTEISYRFGEAGYLGSIMLFNASGRMVRHLVNNEMLGTEGSYSWDGTCDDRTKATAGIYVILVELVDLNGKVLRHKRTVVIAP